MYKHIKSKYHFVQKVYTKVLENVYENYKEHFEVLYYFILNMILRSTCALIR